MNRLQSILLKVIVLLMAPIALSSLALMGTILSTGATGFMLLLSWLAIGFMAAASRGDTRRRSSSMSVLAPITLVFLFPFVLIHLEEPSFFGALLVWLPAVLLITLTVVSVRDWIAIRKEGESVSVSPEISEVHTAPSEDSVDLNS